MSLMTKEEKDAIKAKGIADKKVKEEAESVDESEKEPVVEDEESEDTEEKKEESTEEEIDFEAIATAEAERADKAEKALAEKEFKSREAKRKDGDKKEENAEDEENKPLTKRELRSLLAEERQATQTTLQEGQALEIAKNNTASEAEAKAAVAYWKNRVVKTGNLEDDVMFAIGGLNHKRVIAKNAELKRSLKSKETASKSGVDSHRVEMSAKEVKMSSADANAIKASGFIWDGNKRLWKKPLGDGKTFLYYDSKNKKRWKGK